MGAKNIVKSKRAEGAQKFLGLHSGLLLRFFNWITPKFICFPHSERNTKKEVLLDQDKGRPSYRKWGAKPSFHHEGGGQLPPTAPPKSATELMNLWETRVDISTPSDPSPSRGGATTHPQLSKKKLEGKGSSLGMLKHFLVPGCRGHIF